MNIKSWNKSCSKSVRLGQDMQNGGGNEDDHQPGWLKLWRKIRRKNKNKKKEEKNKKSCFNRSMSMQISYDPQSYLRNFDEGLWTKEPDNLVRSFSARYADPSISLRRVELLG